MMFTGRFLFSRISNLIIDLSSSIALFNDFGLKGLIGVSAIKDESIGSIGPCEE